MKKLLKPFQPEESVYYSDFSGKILENTVLGMDPPIKVVIHFNYGSKRDGEMLELDLNDEDFDSLLEFLKTKMIKESQIKIQSLL